VINQLQKDLGFGGGFGYLNNTMHQVKHMTTISQSSSYTSKMYNSK